MQLCQKGKNTLQGVLFERSQSSLIALVMLILRTQSKFLDNLRHAY